MSIHDLMTVAGVLCMAQACVVYDRHCDNGDCRDHDWRGHGSYCGTTETGLWEEEVPDPPPAYTLKLDPAAAAAGDTLIAYLSVDGDLTVAAISTIVFLGEVEVLAVDPREEEMVLTLHVDEQAKPGPVDALVTLLDGTGRMMPEAFEVLESEQGQNDDTGKDCDTGF